MNDGASDDADAGGESSLAVVASGATRVFGGRIAKLLLVLATQIAMARVLGPVDYGGVVIAQMAIGVGSVVAALGIDTGLARKVPLYELEPEKVRGVVRAGLTIGLVSGTAVGALLFVASPALATRLFGDTTVTPLLRLAAIAIPFGVVSHVAGAVARGAGSTLVRVVVRQLLNPVVNFLLVAVLLLAGYGAVGATAAVVGTIALGSVVGLVLALRALPVSVRGPTNSIHRELLVFSLPLLLASSVEFVLVNTDTFLIGVFLGPTQVGVYDVAFKLRQFGLFFFYPVTFLLPTVLTRLDRDAQLADAQRIYQVTTKWLVLLSTPPVLLLFLFPEVIIGLTFGQAYRPGATAMQVLLVAVMVTVLLSANGSALVALGHSRINAVVNGATAALNLTLNLALIPVVGILGAAIASASAFIFRDVAYSVALYRREGLQPFSGALLRPYSATVLVGGVSYAVSIQLFTEPVVSLVAVTTLLLVTYVPLLISLGALEPEDERLLDRLEERAGVDLTGFRAGLRRLRQVG